MSQSTGYKLPVSAALSGSGPAWANITRITANDGSSSDVTVSAAAGLQSQGLSGTNFGLLEEDGGTIPADATIIKVEAEFEMALSVTNSVIANQATLTMTTRSPGATIILTGTVTQNDDTSSAMAFRLLNTGGTEAVPQTDYTRADLADPDLTLRVLWGLPAGALNSATAQCDCMRVRVTWIKYVEGQGIVARGHAVSSAKNVTQFAANTVARGHHTRAEKKWDTNLRHAAPARGHSISAGKKWDTNLRRAIVARGHSISAGKKWDTARKAIVARGHSISAGKKWDTNLRRAVVVRGHAMLNGVKVTELVKAAKVVRGHALSGSDLTEFLRKNVVARGHSVSGGRIMEALMKATVVRGHHIRAHAIATAATIAGVVYDAETNNPVAGATVWVFRTSDKALVGETTTDGVGAYSVTLPVDDTIDYYCRAHIDTPSRTFGTTDRNLRVEINIIYESP